MEKFVVSARKYRPITFESVVGQKHITSTLRNAIKRDQVAHAYLFCGPRGVGKTTCARILSKTLNCLTPLEGIEPCGECESCRAFEENRSFNIHELDAASNNSVENIRALNEQVRIAPQIGKYSIYIIDEAHMLSTAAFNAFLKTLEEPPAHAIFILATTEKHKILPTIISRCQIYDFKRIKVEDMVKFLSVISEKEGISYDDESLHIISQKADGCMRDALSMYDKVVSFCGSNLQFKEVAESLNVLDYDSYFKFTDLFTSGDYKASLLQFDEILQKGFDSMTFLGGLASHLRNLLIAADNSTISLLELTGTIAQRFSEQGRRVSTSIIFDSLNIISAAESNARFSLNVRLLAELTILKLCNLSPIKISNGSVEQKYSLPQLYGGSEIKIHQTVKTEQAQQPKQPQEQVTQQPTESNIPKTKSGRITQPKSEPQQQATTQPTQQLAAQVVQQNIGEVKAKDNEEKEKAKPTRKTRSLVGVSISSMIKSEEINSKKELQSSQDNETDIVSCQDNEIDLSMVIAPHQIETVLIGCNKYAEWLKNRRPRLSSAFEFCKIEDGVLTITVGSNIIRDDIEAQRHSITEELINFCNIGVLTFEIVVDEAIESKKVILIKDEDKLKFLSEKNIHLTKFCSTLDLDYV